MALITRVRGAADGNGLSSEIWHDLPISDMLADPSCVIDWFDDFVNNGDLGAGTILGPYAAAMDTSNDVQQLLAHEGILRLSLDNTDNDQAAIQTSGGVGGPIEISDTAGEGYKMWFEARVRLSTITDQTVFLGFAEEAMQIADALIADGGTALKDKDYVGFRVLSGDPDGLDAVHNKESGGGEVVVKNEAQVLVAATWYKLGMVYEPARFSPLDGKIFRYYVDGVEVGSITSLPSTFPDAELMAFLMTIKNGDGTARNFDIDWVRWAQLRVGR